MVWDLGKSSEDGLASPITPKTVMFVEEPQIAEHNVDREQGARSNIQNDGIKKKKN